MTLLPVLATTFLPGAGLIAFDEPGYPIGMPNPVYPPSAYGGAPEMPIVSFGRWFVGQAVASSPWGKPYGGTTNSPFAERAYVLGLPANPLRLDPAAPPAIIAADAANPTAPVLGGFSTDLAGHPSNFQGSIAVFFSTNQVGVGFEAGFFDTIGSTQVTVYDRTGAILGSILNQALGIEYLGIGLSDGAARIAGLLFHAIGSEPAGFGTDNWNFAIVGQLAGFPAAPLPDGCPSAAPTSAAPSIAATGCRASADLPASLDSTDCVAPHCVTEHA